MTLVLTIQVVKKMGLKRPFAAEEMQECNAKHARQLSYNHDQLNQFDEAIPYYHVSMEKTGVLGIYSVLLSCKGLAWLN